MIAITTGVWAMAQTFDAGGNPTIALAHAGVSDAMGFLFRHFPSCFRKQVMSEGIRVGMGDAINFSAPASATDRCALPRRVPGAVGKRVLGMGGPPTVLSPLSGRRES